MIVRVSLRAGGGASGGAVVVRCGVYFRVRDQCGAYRWGGWLCAGWLVYAVRIGGGDWVEVAAAF